MWHNLVNTEYFKEAANDFKKNGGRYTMATRGSREYNDYWKEQELRCRQGYKVGDTWIPGRYYFYLNFFPMWKVPDETALAAFENARDKNGRVSKRTADKILDFPRFHEMQYEWWMFKHIAWHGGTFMGINSPGGKHIACGKTRGAGFSYMEAADGVYNYNFIPGSKSYYFAAREDYLTKDGILVKVQEGLDWINEYSPRWLQNRHEKNTLMHQKASYVDELGNKKGKKAEIIGVIVNDPNKTRGKRGRKITFEEAGSFKNLKAAVEISLGSLRDGDFYVGQMSVFGCVCAGTEVYKADGTKVLIENLQQEDGILGYNGRGISKEPIVWMQPPAMKECVELELETGVKLRCSIDHPILATRTDKDKPCAQKDNRRKVSFIEAATLTKEHQVAVIESIPFFGTLNVKEAYTLGYLIGDGYYGGTIECIIDNEVSLTAIENDCDKIELKRIYSSTLASYSIGGNIRQLVKKNGMHGQSKLEKRFPTNWREYDKESLAKLIAGYFDADGNIKIKKDKDKTYVSVVFSSIVPELLDTLQEALMKFGIHSNIGKEFCKGGYTDGHTIYRLYINRVYCVLKFREDIPILSPNKQVPEPSAKITKLLEKAKLYNSSIFDHSVPLTAAQLYQVKSVTFIGQQPIYNLNAGTTHTYLANNVITHNTGGEQGESLEGLEDMFYNPHTWDMLAFPNIWENGGQTECGYFVPSFRANFVYTDKDGNTDIQASIRADEEERDKKRASRDPKNLDRRKAEYPQKPSEMFNRLDNNGFDIAAIDKQIKKMNTDREVQSLLRYGKFERSTSAGSIGGVEFVVGTREKYRPIEEYPHKHADDLSGCVTIVEFPYQAQDFKVPNGMYQLVFDAYYKEEAEDKTSLFDFRVFKLDNPVDPTFNRLPVAWGTMRPARLSTCYEQMFMMADYYNCTIQGEISGGGQGVMDYAKAKRLLHKMEFEPEMLHNKEIASKQKNRTYLMNMSTDRKRMGMTYLEQWHVEPIGMTQEGEIIRVIDKIYDIGLLRELRQGGLNNSDRMSSCLIAMFMLKEHVVKVSNVRRQPNDFYERAFFAECSDSQEFTSLY